MLLRVRVEPFFRHVRLLLEQHTCVGGMQGQGQSKGWAANHVCFLDEVPLPNSDFDRFLTAVYSLRGSSKLPRASLSSAIACLEESLEAKAFAAEQALV